MYINSHSYYSLRYGTLSVEALVEEAVKRGIQVMALTDINNSTGVLDFVKCCTKEGIQPVAGIEFREKDRLLYVGLARNNQGFMELNEFLSFHNISGESLPHSAPPFQHVVVIYPFGSRSSIELRENEYLGIRPQSVRRLVSLKQSHNLAKLVEAPLGIRIRPHPMPDVVRLGWIGLQCSRVQSATNIAGPWTDWFPAPGVGITNIHTLGNERYFRLYQP